MWSFLLLIETNEYPLIQYVVAQPHILLRIGSYLFQAYGWIRKPG